MFTIVNMNITFTKKKLQFDKVPMSYTIKKPNCIYDKINNNNTAVYVTIDM